MDTKPGAFDKHVLAACLLIVFLALSFPAPDREDQGVTVAGMTIGSTCVFKQMTGIDCPFCGMTRSTVALFHGDLAGSMKFHPLGLALAVFVLVQVIFRAGRLMGSGIFLAFDKAPYFLRMAPVHILLFALLIRWFGLVVTSCLTLM